LSEQEAPEFETCQQLVHKASSLASCLLALRALSSTSPRSGSFAQVLKHAYDMYGEIGELLKLL